VAASAQYSRSQSPAGPSAGGGGGGGGRGELGDCPKEPGLDKEAEVARPLVGEPATRARQTLLVTSPTHFEPLFLE
jgi:hypothetical protein